jgi:hypothetical protein
MEELNELNVKNTSAVGPTKELEALSPANAPMGTYGKQDAAITRRMVKEQEKERQYWNSMIKRSEARDLVLAATRNSDEKMRLLYVSTNTMLAALKDKGILTEEEFNTYAKPFMEQMYGVSTDSVKEEAKPTEKPRKRKKKETKDDDKS